MIKVKLKFKLMFLSATYVLCTSQSLWMIENLQRKLVAGAVHNEE